MFKLWENNTHNSNKCCHLHPELRLKKKEVNLVKESPKLEADRLWEVISSLTKQVKELKQSKDLTRQKNKRKKNLDILEEELACHAAMMQMAKNIEDSESDTNSE